MTEVKFPSMVDMPDKEYFAHPAIDQSGLKKFMESPRAYAWSRLNPLDTDALAFGKAAHSLILGSGPTVERKLDGRTKAGKEQAERAKSEDLVVLTGKDYEKLQNMVDYAPDMKALVAGKPEIALFAIDPQTGLELKCKVDWLPDKPDMDGTMYLYDYKTTGHSVQDFVGSAYKFGYHIQAAFYMMVYKLVTGFTGPMGFRFIVQEKQPPYDWMIWELLESSPEISMVAERQIRNALTSFSFYKKHDVPLKTMLEQGLPKMPVPIQFTDWQMNHLIGDDDQWEM